MPCGSPWLVSWSARWARRFIFSCRLQPIWLHRRSAGGWLGSVFSGILLGILLARTFSGIVGAHLGWRAVYGISSALMLCVAILVQFLLPRSKPVTELPYLSLVRSTVDLIRIHPELRESAFLGASLFCCFSAFWTTLVFLLETPPYHYVSQAAGLFGLVGAAGAAGAPLVGRFADNTVHVLP